MTKIYICTDEVVWCREEFGHVPLFILQTRNQCLIALAKITGDDLAPIFKLAHW